MRGASPHVGQVRRPGRREPWRGGVASGWVRGAGERADVNFIIAQMVADVTVTDQRGRGEPRLSARRSRDAGSVGLAQLLVIPPPSHTRSDSLSLWTHLRL